MSQRTRRILFQIGSFLVAGGLLYLALRGVDFDRVGQDLRTANYWWLLPIVVVTLGSHWLRAWRWTLFLEHVPPKTEGVRDVSTGGAFAAIMMGYLANYAAPRLGEVVRTASVASRYRRPFGAVFGTVVSERVLDMLTLGLAMLTLPLVFSGRIQEINALLIAPAIEWVQEIPAWIVWTTAAALSAAGVVLLRWLWDGIRNRPSESDLALPREGENRPSLRQRVHGLLWSFRDGLTSVTLIRNWTGLWGVTVAMWLCYLCMAYFPFVMFGFHISFGVTPFDAWGIMLLGALGVVIPSPGGFGSYHYITIQSLVLLFAFPQDAAASYAILTHTGQLVIYVVTGGLFVAATGFSIRSLAEHEA